MSKKNIAIATDINKIPYINDGELILTLGEQKIWYTTNIKAINVPGYVKFSNSIVNSFIKKFFKKSNKHDIVKFNYFTKQAASYLKNSTYDEVVFENEQLKNKILPNFKNKNEFVVKKEAVSVNG